MVEPDVRIRAGELRHRVTFLRRVPGQDDMGQPNTAFAPLFVADASVNPINGREYFSAGHYVNDVDTEIRIRYGAHEDLRATDEVQVDGPQGGRYAIQGVLNPAQYGRALRILAKRVA
jgi:SPP1 family predicted phage head-tail adaptor